MGNVCATKNQRLYGSDSDTFYRTQNKPVKKKNKRNLFNNLTPE